MARLILWFIGFLGSIIASILFTPWFLFSTLLFLILFFLLVYYVLAKQNRWWTFNKESTAKFIVKGGKIEKLLIQMEGRTYDYGNADPVEKWAVIKVDDKHPVEKHPLGGLRFYSWLHPLVDVYVYKFRWAGVNERGEIKQKEEWLDYVSLKDDIYWFEADACEDQKLLPLVLEVLITVRIINPYKAIFKVQRWLEITINRMKPFIRDYVTNGTYEGLIKEKGILGKKLMESFNAGGLVADLRDGYGVEVSKVEVKDINIDSKQQSTYQDKILAPFMAELEKKVTVTKAEAEGESTAIKAEGQRKARVTIANGEREAKAIEGEGEAKRITLVFKAVQDFGDTGKLVRTLESMEKSNLVTSMNIHAVPGLGDILRSAFGKSPEEVTMKEITELREMIQKIMDKKQ
jgi:hypothetical protein